MDGQVTACTVVCPILETVNASRVMAQAAVF